MRHVLAGLLRDFEAAADRSPLAAAAPAGDDQSMADCLETAGLCDVGSVDLGSVDLDALLESEVCSWTPSAAPPVEPLTERRGLCQKLHASDPFVATPLLFNSIALQGCCDAHNN